MLEEAQIAIDLLKGPCSIERAAGGDYANGTWTAAFAPADATYGVIQPVSGKELKDMPEGIRAEASALFFITEPDLKGAEISVGDLISADNQKYKLIHVAEWSRHGRIRECILGRVKS